jgi:uncharacterized phage protein (TIGR01671 family)
MRDINHKQKKSGRRDRNGKEIREGDVVRIDGWKKLLGIIEYQAPHFMISLQNVRYGSSAVTWQNWQEDVEVIGTIYEHPDLISKAA